MTAPWGVCVWGVSPWEGGPHTRQERLLLELQPRLCSLRGADSRRELI